MGLQGKGRFGALAFGALAGVAAAAVALGVAELVAVATGPRSAPLVAVGGVVIDHVPEPVKQLAISAFGVHDKTALLVGTVLLLAVFAAVVGALAVRSIWAGLAGIAAFAAVGVAAALTRPGAGPEAALPALVGAAAAGGVLWLLTGPLRVAPARATVPATAPAAQPDAAAPGPVAAAAQPAVAVAKPSVAAEAVKPSIAAAEAGEPAPAAQVEVAPPAGPPAEPERVEPEGAEPERAEPERAGRDRPGSGEPAPAEAVGDGGRRRFLGTVAAVLGGAAVAAVGGRLLSTNRDVAAARAAVTLPPPASPAPAVPAGAELGVPELAPYVTSNRDFYRIDTALVVPRVDPRTWALRVHGRVRNPFTISFDELVRRPAVERYVTLACVSNEVGGDLISNARWLGVPLREVLDEAGPLDGADQVVGRSADGWTCGTPTAVLRDGRDALLAYGMNGEPLPIEHGFPVRMVVPGLYGYVSACKWVVELELTSFDAYDAYWVPRGWAAQAPIKTQSRIDTPRDGATARSGTVTVAGVAWAQHRGIKAVEVRVDDGPWQPATLADTVSIDTWRQWSWRWEAPAPGEHTLAVRATDAEGVIQPAQRQPVAPDGATGWHTIRVSVT